MNIYYVNNRGIKLDLLLRPYRIQTGDIFDSKWDYESIVSGGRGKIKRFTKGIRTKTLLLGIMSSSKQSFYDALNHFYEVTEQDVLAEIPGKLYVGDYYLNCYIFASKKTDWEYDCDVLDNEISLVTDYPFWIKETGYTFKSADIASTDNKRYGHRYGYRYANGLKDTYIVNEHFDSVHFKLRIYGKCVNPLINIGGHSYMVHTILQEGEYLEIDSMQETVFKTMLNGTKVNLFHYRGRDVFTKILPGRQQISWDGKFDFDIILFEERSEPKMG